MDFQSAKSLGKLRLRAFQPYHQMLYMLTLSTLGISISNVFNAMYVDTLDTNYIHICAHNFLNILRIFNPKKSFRKLRLRAFQPYHQILYMLTLSTLGISISNAFNAIYVDTVNTKHIHTFLPITFLMFNGFSIHKKFWKAETQGFSTIPSILYMSILSIQDKDL